MKIKEILEEQELTKYGTYAGAHFSDATVDALSQYCKDNNIPNAIAPDKFHTTILYSRKHCPDYKARGKFDPMLVGTPHEKFHVWKTSPSDPNAEKTNCLILPFDCPDLVARHKELMDTHGATYDYDEYKPHVTLSYNIGDIDADSLPPFKGKIEIADEYQEDLDLDWAKTKANK